MWCLHFHLEAPRHTQSFPLLNGWDSECEHIAWNWRRPRPSFLEGEEPVCEPSVRGLFLSIIFCPHKELCCIGCCSRFRNCCQLLPHQGSGQAPLEEQERLPMAQRRDTDQAPWDMDSHVSHSDREETVLANTISINPKGVLVLNANLESKGPATAGMSRDRRAAVLSQIR